MLWVIAKRPSPALEGTVLSTTLSTCRVCVCVCLLRALELPCVLAQGWFVTDVSVVRSGISPLGLGVNLFDAALMFSTNNVRARQAGPML